MCHSRTKRRIPIFFRVIFFLPLCHPERKLLESKDLREAILFPRVILSEAKSYLARYFTGEAASSQSDEAVRVLRIGAKAKELLFFFVSF